jgi:protein involved in polysaccharide export with SLBB domain
MPATRPLLVLLIALTVGCANATLAVDEVSPLGRSAEPVASNSSLDLSDYRLGTGDRVRIDVFGEPDLTIDAVVDGTGHISYPLLGAVPAQKKTASELRSTITSGLAAGYLKDPDVRVTVVQYRPFYTIGQVKRPGAYPYVLGLTVEKAIAIAGGLTNLASTRQIYLLREASNQARRIKVGLDAAVLPGDTLLIEEGLF